MNTHKINAALFHAEKYAHDAALTTEQIEDRREFGRNLLSALDKAVAMINGDIPRSSVSIDEKIAYWKKLAEASDDETD